MLLTCISNSQHFQGCSNMGKMKDNQLCMVPENFTAKSSCMHTC